MRFALLNPRWTFEGSIYFGCPKPHLPLELGYPKTLLERDGHEVLMLDGWLDDLSHAAMRAKLEEFQPDISVVTTAPSYLFWRCAPPELTVPRACIDEVRDVAGKIVGIGPHCSTTPRTALKKLEADAVILGEPDTIIPRLAGDWSGIDSFCQRVDGRIEVRGTPAATDMAQLQALRWPDHYVTRHVHHHHRFPEPPGIPGAEVEASRGCPYHCTFCAKDNFRNLYRKRPIGVILEELDRLIGQGAQYFYFIDEIFLPQRDLLEQLRSRHIRIGVQTRIDLWSAEMIELLAAAGCESIEAGVESITEEGRAYLDKKCRLSTDQLGDRLIYAKSMIPFVQANLISVAGDDPDDVERWRENLMANGVWANKPVPLFPYPGSPDYTRLWGAVDDLAWERAHAHYLGQRMEFSDIQDQQPLPLVQLEAVVHGG